MSVPTCNHIRKNGRLWQSPALHGRDFAERAAWAVDKIALTPCAAILCLQVLCF